MTTRRILAYAFTPGIPPREIQLWNVGDNPTDYGVHRWTDRSVDAVMSRYAERGNPLQVDVEHNCSVLSEADEDVPHTGGYCRLEIRNGAPWLTFDWSAVAIEQIESRQRLYLSPEYLVDETTGEIVELLRVSLVGSPGTHHARVLASADARKLLSPLPGMDFETLLAAIRAALANEDADAATAAIKALLAEIDKGSAPAAGDAPPADEPVAAEGDAPAEDKNDEPVAASDASSKDEPVAASEEEKKDEPVAAQATKASAPKAATKASSPAESAALKAVADLRRDMLLRDHGDRLEPSIRRWAASQSCTVVEGLIAAASKKTAETTQRVAATRGAGQGTNHHVAGGLAGREADDMARAFGRVAASEAPRFVNEPGRLVLPAIPPAQLRAQAATKKDA